MVKVNPYLNFNGNCEEAFNFYRSVFGGDFTYIGRFKDIPGQTQPDPEDAEKIMHISIGLGGGTILMGSDIPKSYEDHFVTGTNVNLTLSPDNEEEARRVFDSLASGGRVTMPMDKTFWGSLFGMLTDKFGINWMVDFELPKEGQA